MENYVNEDKKDWSEISGWIFGITAGLIVIFAVWYFAGGGQEWVEGNTDVSSDVVADSIIKNVEWNRKDQARQEQLKDELVKAQVESAKRWAERDTTAIKNEMRRQQINILKKIEIAKAERVMHEMQHQAIMERDRQDMERHKVRTLYSVKDVMYQGLIKKLKEMADDETLSFDMLYNKYKEKLQLFEKDLLKVDITSLSASDDSIGVITFQVDGNKGQKTVEP